MREKLARAIVSADEVLKDPEIQTRYQELRNHMLASRRKALEDLIWKEKERTQELRRDDCYVKEELRRRLIEKHMVDGQTANA